MNFQFIIYFSLLVFLMGIFGIFYNRDIISVFISFQFIIISAVINFLSFSQFLYQSSLWDEIFIIFGIASIYFLMFCIICYFYLKLDLLDREALNRDFILFKVVRHDWCGEDEM
ncbi:MAG TPA: hypothetical protein VIH07_04185 [Candidatus Humimicrobiaceae bacterium]